MGERRSVPGVRKNGKKRRGSEVIFPIHSFGPFESFNFWKHLLSQAGKKQYTIYSKFTFAIDNYTFKLYSCN